MDDQKIIELIRSQKNDKALIALYKNFPMIRKMIRLKGGTAADAEDVFQEALIILCRKVKATDFTLTAQLSTYLFSVCRLLWKDEWKKRKHHNTYTLENDVTEPEEEALQQMILQEEQAKLAEKVLHELGHRCRELLLLFYQGGLKLKEIAARMGYNTENTAKNQKYKCLEGAKNRLKELKQTMQTS
jgi:RNA polymerase sigma factor (sigma-70 family)